MVSCKIYFVFFGAQCAFICCHHNKIHDMIYVFSFWGVICHPNTKNVGAASNIPTCRMIKNCLFPHWGLATEPWPSASCVPQKWLWESKRGTFGTCLGHTQDRSWIDAAKPPYEDNDDDDDDHPSHPTTLPPCVTRASLSCCFGEAYKSQVMLK